jgi:endogenous inhibitor of DNA gyrase (YacG/DUF329 family)
MFDTQNTAIVADAQPSKAPARVCPNCGNSFAAGGRGLGKTFCGKQCRMDFNNRAKAEGAVIIALAKCWTQNRHAKPDTREAELCRQSRSELTEILRMMLDADADAGRPPVADYVETLFASGTLYVDRTRKF